MWQTKLAWFLWGWNTAVWIVVFYLKYKLHYCKCDQCGKKYWRKRSGCQKYPMMFCSEDCNRLYTMDTLIKNGASVEIAAQIAAMEDEDATG